MKIRIEIEAKGQVEAYTLEIPDVEIELGTATHEGKLSVWDIHQLERVGKKVGYLLTTAFMGVKG